MSTRRKRTSWWRMAISRKIVRVCSTFSCFFFFRIRNEMMEETHAVSEKKKKMLVAWIAVWDSLGPLEKSWSELSSSSVDIEVFGFL